MSGSGQNKRCDDREQYSGRSKKHFVVFLRLRLEMK
jgi:hypothetical protein